MYVNVSTVSDASSEFKFNLRDVVWSESTDKIYKLIPATQNEWLESICISTFPRKELRHGNTGGRNGTSKTARNAFTITKRR